jgi:predicted RNase H-like HicB family nuclease
LTSIKYELIIYWSEEDQSFVVEVPELPGCMADGETYEQAVANAQQVIGEWRVDRDCSGAWSANPGAAEVRA